MRHQQMDVTVPDWLIELAEIDDQVRRKLLSVKDDPEFLGVLIKSLALKHKPTDEKSNVALGTNAAIALGKWAATGFSKTPIDRLQARLAACRSCPYLETSSPRQAWMFVPENQREFCSACGCPISRKAAMLSESCPMPADGIKNVSRWGEPMER